MSHGPSPLRLLGLALACASIAWACGADDPAPPNLIVVNVDTLRADHLSVYGYPRDTAPFLAELAEASVVFEAARSNSSFTRESVGSLLTGRLPSRLGRTGWNAAPDASGPHLGRLLARAGHRTAFLSNTVMLKHRGFSQGFDVVQHLPERWDLSGAGAKLVDRALAFLDAGAPPFGLYLHFLDPHAPYAPPPERMERLGAPTTPAPLSLYEEAIPGLAALRAEGFGPGDPRFEDLIARYDAEIRDVDAALRALFEGLEARGLAERTVVVVTADHGEEFLEHDYLEHGWTLYDEVLRVPLLLWAPGRLAPARVAEPVSQIDLLPTLATLLGLSLDADSVDGVSWLEASGDGFRVSPPSRPQVAELLLGRRSMLRSVVLDGWKYIAVHHEVAPEDRSDHDASNAKPPAWSPTPVREQLFDLTRDPGERRDLVADHPERAAALATHLPALRVAPSSNPEAGLDDAERERLRQLGYL